MKFKLSLSDLWVTVFFICLLLAMCTHEPVFEASTKRLDSLHKIDSIKIDSINGEIQHKIKR